MVHHAIPCETGDGIEWCSAKPMPHPAGQPRVVRAGPAPALAQSRTARGLPGHHICATPSSTPIGGAQSTTRSRSSPWPRCSPFPSPPPPKLPPPSSPPVLPSRPPTRASSRPHPDSASRYVPHIIPPPAPALAPAASEAGGAAGPGRGPGRRDQGHEWLSTSVRPVAAAYPSASATSWNCTRSCSHALLRYRRGGWSAVPDCGGWAAPTAAVHPPQECTESHGGESVAAGTAAARARH